MFVNLRGDTQRLRESRSRRFPWYFLEALLLDNGYQAVVLYRLASWLKRHRVPLLGSLVSRFGLFVTGADISPNSSFGPGLLISHGAGLVVGGAVRAGSRTVLLHQVTLGGSRSRMKMPTLGDNVFVAPGAQLLGGINIGNNVFVGAGSIVTFDIPDDSKVTSNATVVVSTRPVRDSREWIA